MDILRVLGSPDLEVRKKTLSLVLELVNSRNVDEVTIWLCILENTVITLSLVCSPCVHHWFALCACTIGLLSVRAPLVCSPCVHHWFALRACTIGLLSVRAPLVCSPFHSPYCFYLYAVELISSNQHFPCTSPKFTN